MNSTVKEVKTSEFYYIENHPIKIRKNERYDSLLTSIKENGLLEKVVVRKRKGKKGYEVIDGRLRVEVFKDLGIDSVPVRILSKNDEDTIIHLLDSNIRRDDTLPSELGHLFKMRMEVMNNQGKRTDLTCGSDDHKRKSRAEIAKSVGKSGRTVSKYIRLTFLHPELLGLVDSGKLYKLVFDYDDFLPFFEENTPVEQMKADILKVLSYWMNNRK